MVDGLEILPVRGIGDVPAGADLAELITRHAPWLRDGDVLVVTSKIVSKAEGRLVEVPADGPERDAARAAALAAETRRVVARRGSTSIVQTHHGFIMAAAGIDASNVDKTHLVLLPKSPDDSARRLRAALAARGLQVGIIVSDTMGRAWRNGLTDVALGAAGVGPFRDHRGEIDPYGNELQLTQMAVVDELAAAGELVKGKCDQVPVAVVRGYPGVGAAETPGADVLLRDSASDMFSLGTAEAHAEGLRTAATLPQATAEHPADADAVHRALATAGLDDVVAAPAPHTLRCTVTDSTPEALMQFGADVHRLRSALAAEGLSSTVTYDQTGATIAVTATEAAATRAAVTATATERRP
ncbi:coenzyme F420-0:L-glutamate ligase [Actinoplanes sp. NPDC051859]|uniref:coenzyme F420-0:L-glutamate ligase n=1 Tax=Actinoplanes sp. NPDC051859 TaxID=3363909 RepID=UPI00379044F4